MKRISTLITTAFISLALITTAVAEEAEDFKFNDIKGKSHTFSEYKGKWVIVNYWGTYCPPCLEEIPDLVSFAEKHKKDAVVLGFDAGGIELAAGEKHQKRQSQLDRTIHAGRSGNQAGFSK